MLIQRVITALLLLPLLLAAIWYLPPPALYAVFCAAGLLAAWEWAGLMPRPGAGLRAGFTTLCAAAMATAWWWREYALWLSVAAAVWWLIAIVLLANYPQNFERSRPGRVGMSLIGLVLLVPTMLALASLRAMEDGALRLLFLFFLIFAADIGAYLAGRNLGRTKLAPSVSPGKTIEGMVGGMLLCAAWGVAAGTGVFRLSSPAEIGWIVLLSLVVAAFSVVGDLTESMFKRMAGVKDSGQILPGHGGMLDRVDSVLAGAPVMALGLSLLKL
ncbi:MAG: phosphatidate cytidylyltransferase [Panacagrimonas sp.]